MVHGTNMGPIWGRQDPGGPHVIRMNFAISDATHKLNTYQTQLLRVKQHEYDGK